MNAHYLTALTALLAASCAASGQETPKPVPAKIPAKAPAKNPASGEAKTGGTGPTTTSGRGPTTSNPAGGRGTTTPVKPVASRETTLKAQTTARTRDGSEIGRRADGRLVHVSVAGRGMEIHHNLSGSRRVEVNRADRSRVVAERGGLGYVERPYNYRGREYARRSYYMGGRALDRFYVRYPYHGVYVEMYTPTVYYGPAFYSWAYAPWVAPVSYSWSWAGSGLSGFAGYYFTPYFVYPGPSFWLADFVVILSLSESYQARLNDATAAQAPPSDAAVLTPQVKDLIAAEVQRQIAIENAEAQTVAQNGAPDQELSGVQALLYDNTQHVFVAPRELDVVDAGGSECSISGGDALRLTGPPPHDSATASLVVLASRGGQECHRGSIVSVSIVDLQEMENHLREAIDMGLGILQSEQGTRGLPAIPAAANAAPVKAPFAADPNAPSPDPNAATEIKQEAQEADQAEKQLLSQAALEAGSGNARAGQGAAPTPPVVLSPGQSVDEVRSLFGSPLQVVNLAGGKQIYVYKDVKVTFTGGKVTDIE